MSTAALPESPQPPRAASPAREALELLSSMRFAIALLCVIAIAAIVGTVVEQRQPQIAYLNQFGPFWADVFHRLGLHAVYGTWWFLLIMAFLVVSTSLCIARNTPKILADLRTFKEALRTQSLKAFHHRAEGRSDETPAAAVARIEAALAAAGWKLKADARPAAAGQEAGTMLAAKKGRANRVGYILAHSAIVLICLGGLADGDLAIRLQMWMQGLRPYVPGPQADIASAQHRLGAGNPSYRGNLQVAEGQRNGYAVLSLTDGLLLQPLPFEIELKSFRVEFHDAGPPKRFVSEVVVHDGEQAIPATILVNQPFIHRGVAVYQSDFGDGGSPVRLRSWLLASGRPGPEVEGTVGGSQALAPELSGAQPLRLELDDLRVINVENLGTGDDAQAAQAASAASTSSTAALERLLGAADKSDRPKNMHNVGPVLVYKLRDPANQAREFRNYMLPIELDGQRVFLLGQRNSPSEDFSYLRIPADENGAMDGWMRLRAALADPAARAEAARRYVQRALPQARGELGPRMAQTAERVLGLFAGAVQPRGQGQAPGGLAAISQDIEGGVPQAQREATANALMPVLKGALFELADLARERAGLPAQRQDEAGLAFNTQALLSLSDAFFYGAPAVLSLADFRKVQASVFQVTRSPGKNIVYLGALLLIAGVFCMLFVRERRLWVWVGAAPAAGAATQITMALSANRQTMDIDREFAALVRGLLPAVVAQHPPLPPTVEAT